MGRVKLGPQAQRLAAGYLRISDERKQGDNYSPEVQRAQIAQLAAREGYTVALWDSDHERGRRITRRTGYLRILEAARRGAIGAIITSHTNRWGRRTGEMVDRLDELDARGIAFYSVAQGRLRPGIVSTLLFAIDEEFCRTLAHTVRPARQAGARAGIHQGPTPFGYRRVYPAWDGSGKRPAGQLVPDAATSWIVVVLYERYAAGATCRELALWLNLELRQGAPRAQHTQHGQWADDTVYNILRNPTYRGVVGYDRRGQGAYERAAEGDYFEAQGRHEALVSDELWQRVQERMQRWGSAALPAGARPEREQSRRTYLGAGLLVCRGCGGPMRVHNSPNVKGHKGSYLCWGAMRGRGLCHEPGYRMDLAHEALIREVCRLRGSPWTPLAERHLRPDGCASRERVHLLRAAIDDERRALECQIRLLVAREEPGPAELAAFDRLARESEARITSLQEQLKEAECVPERLPDLRALHERLVRTELHTLLRGLDWAHRDRHVQRVRAILLDTVASAALTERQPEHFSRWLRLGVNWTTDVQDLLDAGLLRLEEGRSAPPG